MKLATFTGASGHQYFGIVIGGEGMIEVFWDESTQLLEKFGHTPANMRYHRPRVTWVRPTPSDDGPGTRLTPLDGQTVEWVTKELEQLQHSADNGTFHEKVEEMRDLIYEKYY